VPGASPGLRVGEDGLTLNADGDGRLSAARAGAHRGDRRSASLQSDRSITKKHVVKLTEPDRARLRPWITAGSASSGSQARARIVLQADQGAAGPAWSDRATAAALDLSVPNIERTRKRFAEEGLEAEVAASEAERNALRSEAGRRFTADDARIKLKRLYPSTDA
jgi:hypothetical protein